MSWFVVVVQYMPVKMKISVGSLISHLQLAWWFMVVCGGSILLCHLVLNLIKSNAASSDKFKNQLKNII